MAIQDIPVFREAQPGQVVRSADWNEMQQELRNSIRTHQHTRVAGEPVDDSVAEDNALQIAADEIADEAVSLAKLAPEVQAAIESVGEIPEDVIESAMIAEADGTSDQDTNTGTGIKEGHIQDGAVTSDKVASGAVTGVKIASGAVSISKLNADVQNRLEMATARSGLVSVKAREAVKVEHGLGNVQVAVVLGVGAELDIRGVPLFFVYGPQVPVVARVPFNPNGTFEIYSESSAEVAWWAFTGALPRR